MGWMAEGTGAQASVFVFLGGAGWEVGAFWWGDGAVGNDGQESLKIFANFFEEIWGWGRSCYGLGAARGAGFALGFWLWNRRKSRCRAV